MIKTKKANLKGEEKSNKIVKKVGVANPKKKKVQLEKVKKSIKKNLVETPKEEVEEQVSTEDEVLEEAPEAAEAESQSAEENSEAEDAVEKSEDQDGGEDCETETEICTEGTGQTIVLTGLSAKTTRAQLVAHFGSCGKIMCIIFTAEINAYIVFDSVKAVEKALKLNGTVLNGEAMVVTIPMEKQILSNSTISDHRNTIFVKNLNPDSTEESITEFFSSCGKIAFINLKKGHGGKAFAFVCFKSSNGPVASALKMNGKTFEENTITVTRYSPKERKTRFNSQLRSKRPYNKNFKPNNNKVEQKSPLKGVKSGGIKKIKEKVPSQKPISKKLINEKPINKKPVKNAAAKE